MALEYAEDLLASCALRLKPLSYGFVQREILEHLGEHPVE